ncbi:hypothetical protein VTP01DRAFT_10345 [Rhizomucor pusillus]|uniref:uncharacterized protein n=1 Tax=Rhizomucor pusillus TaxID=4840 RepID=UPI0037430846
MSDGLGPHLSIGDHQHHHHHRHSSAVGDDDAEVIETSSRTERRGSRATSHSTRHRFLNGLTAPLHDRHGRPIRRHGQETFGDALMHPFREYELHKQRMKEYEEEMKKWVHSHIDEEKFQRSAPLEEAAPTPVGQFDRLTIHFKHLVGDQDIRITKPMVDRLRFPLSLTEEEVLKLYAVHNTDELIEFLHKTGRNYSVKVHRTINRKRRNTQDSLSSSENDDEGIAPSNIDDEKKASQNQEKEKEKDKVAPGVDPENPDIINLNSNVYLELIYITEEDYSDLEGETSHRRPFFVVPDPDLSDEIGKDSEATWLELFGDVFYVGFLATFTHEHHIVDSHELGVYAAWFVVVWWTWCAGALYSSRYDRSDVVHHIYKIIELCGLVGMAGASSDFWDHPRGFIIGYMVMKAVLLIQYSALLSTAVIAGSFSRRPLGAYVAVNSISLILWGVSLLYLDNRAARFSLWYISIGLEVIVQIILTGNKAVSLAASHLGERFALFTIIVLGENCMGFIRTVMESGTEVRVVVANMFGVVIIFLFFFMYFDDFRKEVLGEVKLSQLWMYLHFPLHLCQVAFGIALTDTISLYESQSAEAVSTASEGTSAVSHLAAALKMAAETTVAAASEEGSSTESHVDPSYVFKSFWVAGGLIICLNALIKIVNTPIAGAKWSAIICSARIINGIIFFALTAVPPENLNGLAMLGIMAAFLILQYNIKTYIQFRAYPFNSSDIVYIKNKMELRSMCTKFMKNLNWGGMHGPVETCPMSCDICYWGLMVIRIAFAKKKKVYCHLPAA